MSTEFRSQTTDELAFVRWAGKVDGRLCPRFEFGTVTNWEQCRHAADEGEIFFALGEDPSGFEPEWFDEVVVDGRASFSEFPITVEVGSGELFRFGVEQ